MLAAMSLQFTQPGRDDRMQSTNPCDYAIAASAGLRVPNDSPTRPSWVLAPATRPRGHESAQGLCSSSTTTCASRASSSRSQQPYVANRLAAGPAAVTPVLANERRASPGTSYVARPPPPQQQQQGVHRERPAIRFGGSGSDGGGGGASNGAVGGRLRRWQYTNYSRHSYGEEDFEFLRSLLHEASDPRSPGAGAATAGAASFVAFPAAAAEATASPAVVTPPSASLTNPTPVFKESPPPWPLASSMAMEARLRATLAAKTLSGGRDGDADSSAVVESEAQKSTAAGDGGDDNTVGYGVTAEDKLRAADDVAACIWLAGDRLREGLIARVRDTWGAAEAEMAGMTSAGCEGCSGSVAAAAAAAGPTARQRTPPLLSSAQHGASRKNVRQVLVNRLETTRKAVEAELKAADEAAAARGEDTVLCDPQRWRGCTALREDVLATLEGFQAENDRDPMVGETALYSTVSCREELLERLKRTRDAMVAKVIAINGAGGPGSGTRGDKNPAIIGSVAALKDVDGFTKGLLEQLEANHAAAEEEHRPSDSSGDLRDGLLARLESTRAAAAAELQKAAGNKGTSINNEATSATGTGSEGGVDYGSDGLGAQGGGGGGMWERGGRQDGAARESEKRGSNSPGAAGATAGGAAGVGTRKRKRAGSGGRRCKHEDCTLHPHFGLTRPEYCSRHKLPGMFNVKGRRCVNLECKRTPVYGKAGDPHPTYCAAHKLADMVDIKNPTCREATCPRQPSFGSPHDRRATYCATHMLMGMVNVRRMLASKSTSKKAKPTKTASSTASGGGGGKKAATAAAGRWV